MLCRTALIMLLRSSTLACLLFSTASMAQVHVNAPVIISGSDAAERQFIVDPATEEADEVLSAGIEQRGTYRFATPEPGATWDITLPSLDAAPVAGTNIVVLAPGPSSGPIEVRVNGSSPFPLVTGLGVPFDGSGLVAGTALSLVSDGDHLHVMNGEAYALRNCPVGTAAVNDHFCAETVQRPASDFFAAITTCYGQGMRLCGWGEYIVLCQNATALGITGTATDWEWTDDSCNENGTARVAGAGNCTAAGTGLVTGSTPRAFRCCFTR